MKYGIVIGNNKRVVAVVGKIVKDILAAKCDEATKVAALEVVKMSSSINNINLSNCTVTNGTKES